MKYFNSLCMTVIALAVFSLSGCKGKTPAQDQPAQTSADVEATADSATVETPSVFPVAYVNVDSLLLEYDFAKQLNEVLLKKQEKSRRDKPTLPALQSILRLHTENAFLRQSLVASDMRMGESSPLREKGLLLDSWRVNCLRWQMRRTIVSA